MKISNIESKFWERDESITRYAKVAPQLFSSEMNLIIPTALKLNKPFNKIKILDLGCGGGRTTKVLYDLGFDVLGIDIAQNLIKELNKNYPEVSANVGDASNLDLKDKSYDIVLFSHNSLDYLYPQTQRTKTLKEINRVLKDDGYFIYSSHTINFLPYNFTLLKTIINNFFQFLTNPGKGYYIEKMQDGSNVITHYSNTKAIKEELKKAGFLLVRSSKQLIDEQSLTKTFLKNLLSWETYYLAQKHKNL